MSRLRLVFAVALLLASLPLGQADAARPRCFGKKATEVGTSGRDVIRGTSGNDVIVTKGGHDLVRGRGGNDLVCTGTGRDEVFAGGGNDKSNLGRGSDFGGGDEGDDVVLGGAGSDFSLGGPGNDSISLGGGSDFSDPSAGVDRYDGGPGFDAAGYLFSPAMTVDLEAGTASGDGDDTLISIEGVEGSAHDDTLLGSSGSNFIVAGPGDDTIDTRGNAGTLADPYGIERREFDFVMPDHALLAFDPAPPPGDDTVTGGSGLNVVSFEESFEPVDVDLQTGKATGMGNDDLNGMNAVIGSQHDDSLRGSADNDGLDGLSGTDELDGRGGDDVVVFFDASDLVVNLDTGSATGSNLVFNPEGPPEPQAFSYTLTAIENVWGSWGGDDQITGSDDDNDLFGLGGNDTLSGLDGNDLLDGSEGSDTGDAGAGTDRCLSIEYPTSCEQTSGPVGRRMAFASWVAWRDLSALRFR